MIQSFHNILVWTYMHNTETQLPRDLSTLHSLMASAKGPSLIAGIGEWLWLQPSWPFQIA